MVTKMVVLANAALVHGTFSDAIFCHQRNFFYVYMIPLWDKKERRYGKPLLFCGFFFFKYGTERLKDHLKIRSSLTKCWEAIFLIIFSCSLCWHKNTQCPNRFFRLTSFSLRKQVFCFPLFLCLQALSTSVLYLASYFLYYTLSLLPK